MAKGAKFRSIRRMIRLDLKRSDIIEQPSLMKTGKFELIKNGATGQLERKFPLVQGHKKQIINQNKIGYRKVKKQFSEAENFSKAFGTNAKSVEKTFYEKLNKEIFNERQTK